MNASDRFATAAPQTDRSQQANACAPFLRSNKIAACHYELARIIYNMLRFGVAYAQKTEAQYAAQVHERRVKNLHRQARELGFVLTPVAEPAAAEPPATATAETAASDINKAMPTKTKAVTTGKAATATA